MKKLFYQVLFLTSAICLYHTNINAQWIQFYNGTGNTEDRANCIAVDNNKNSYVTGSSKGAGSDFDYYTIKYDSNGAVQWSHRYNGPGNYIDEPTDIEVDISGNVYVTGYSFGNGTDYDFATIKYNSNGVVQWTQRYSSPDSSEEKATELSVDNSGNVIVTGYNWINAEFEYDYLTIKYNSSGVQQWIRFYDGTGDYYDLANYVVTDASGNVYVTGTSYGLDSEYDYLTIKYNASGTLQWTARGNGAGGSYDEAKKVVVDAAGNVYVTGFSYAPGTQYNYLTAKYNSAGVIQWSQYFDGSGNSFDYANDIEVDISGNVYVTGEVYGATSNSDIVTIKYNSSGVVQWNKKYNGISNSFDKGNDLVVDNSGNVYVTGTSSFGFIAIGGEDVITLKYDASGNSRGIILYAGIGESQDNGNAIAIDNSSNVYITGFVNAYSASATSDFITAKYRQADFVPINLQLNAFVEGFYSSANNAQTGDTISMELRYKFPPYALMDSISTYLSNSGNAMANFYGTPPDGYYIILRHRNSIETWSSDTISLSNSVSNYYDFTNSANKAYGNNMKQVDASPVRFATYSGDVTQDGNIDASDMLNVFNGVNSFATGYIVTDVTGDNYVDAADLLLTYNNSINFINVIQP